ncbi:MAG TPA: translation initiation factor IF-2 [Oligoflexia bacterium]|nr:translation initiation factor IF-2 [Oligoflexia bacterium]
MAGLQDVKVYELAKELSMDSITLLDKLRSLDIEVKNHMSALGGEEVRIVKEAIAKEQAATTKSTKTTKTTRTTRKSSATAAAGASTTPNAQEPSAASKKASPTVIRRRAKGGTDDAAVTLAPSQPASSSQPETQPVAETEEAAVVQSAEAPIVEAQPQTEKTVVSTPAPTPPPAPENLGSGLKMHTLLGAKAGGMTSARTGSILNIVKDVPKPIVTPRPAPRPAGPITPGRPGGIINLGKEAIDRMAEEEQSMRKKGAPGARGDRDREPKDVNVLDYRAKKELIFLPKKKKAPIGREIKKTAITKPAAHKRVIRIDNAIVISDLAQRMGVKSGELIKKLMGMGTMVTMNQTIDLDTATLLATEYGFEIENVAFQETQVIKKVEDAPDSLKPRPPVVTVMGHVDHGKTSLLDAIRSEDVAAGEAGGITQHIGAYTVSLDDKKITFIDTPGHEAFTVMRARGANVTDLVILVVAADDGVMPQTREALDHAKAAGVPIIVAVNKMDKPGANPEKIMKALAELDLLSEEWGGQTMFVKVSAIKKTGIKELLEAILLQAEVLDLKANPERAAEGSVLEAQLDRSRGAVVDVLVKHGTLRPGDIVVAGPHVGRVRALTDDKGQPLKEALPGYAAQLLGLEGVPTAGDTFNVMSSDAEARNLAQHRVEKVRAQNAAKTSKMTLEDLFSKVQQGNVKELAVVLKTDVFGSTEAVRDSLLKLTTEKVKVKVLSATTGGITESDVMLASASNAIILGFNVRPETKAIKVAESEHVEIKTYAIIYELIDDVKKAMAGLLEKKAVEKYLGRAEVRQTFSVPKAGTVAGCAVVDGKITRNCQVRLLRENRVIYTGKLNSLRRFKDDAKEVATGFECGMGLENYNDIKQGDIIEAFTVDMVAQELDAPIAQ